jgi:hypothetical protein
VKTHKLTNAKYQISAQLKKKDKRKTKKQKKKCLIEWMREKKR